MWEKAVWIQVDANESRCGLAKLLAETWDYVSVRRLDVGDVAIGPNVLVERKTTDDFLASIGDGRLFRQARHLAAAVPRPVLIHEGDPDGMTGRMDPGAHRGVLLALAVGFRIPVLTTRDIRETATLIRHMAAQESRRAARRRRRTRIGSRRPRCGAKLAGALPPEAIEVLLALPRVGHTRASALAAHLQSLDDLTRLGIRDLLAIPGIGPDTAARIIDTLHGQGCDELRRRSSSPC